MPYIQRNLLRDEKIICESRPHWIIFGPSVVLAIFSLIMYAYLKTQLNAFSQFSILGVPLYEVTALIIILAAFYQAIKAYIMYRTSEYGITNKRIIMKTGWVQRRSTEIFLDKVEAIYVDQSIVGRILGYGTIAIVGTGGTKDPFLYVPEPLKFRNCAQQQIDNITEQQHH